MQIAAGKPPEGFRQNKNFTGGHMTKKEFKEAMLRGLGRCVIAVRQEPEKYREFVLWACKKDFAYDAQSEGTRALYVYTLAQAYPDAEAFADAAAEALAKYRPNCGWDLQHLSELLSFFAADSYEPAAAALEEKYRELLADVASRRSRPKGSFHAVSDLERLGVILAHDRDSTLRIVRDFGRLYREKSFLTSGEFPWFFETRVKKYIKTVERSGQKDENIACFMRRELERLALWEEKAGGTAALAVDKLKGPALSRRLKVNASSETVEAYAQAYREQREPMARAEALEAFCICPYPGDPEPIIRDTASDNERLTNAAWRALEKIRHPAVRRFALSNANPKERRFEIFAVLSANYSPGDEHLLEAYLREMASAKDWDALHCAGMCIFHIFDSLRGLPRPKALLPLLYEYEPCSFCRLSALELMSRHRMLSTDILEECLWDSNSDIRRLAEKSLKK